MTQSIYDQLDYLYDKKRQFHREQALQRKRELYQLEPRFQQIDDIVTRTSEEIIQAGVETEADFHDIEQQLNKLWENQSEERNRLLKEYKLPDNYLDVQSDCPHCKDQGVLEDGSPCHCYKKAYAIRLYKDQNLLDEHAPSLHQIDTAYYKEPHRDWMKQTIDALQDQITLWENGSSQSLLFSGKPGSGKSYVSISLAKSLSEEGFYVIYQSAPEIFDVDMDERRRNRRTLMDCDVLIIDDLGRENNTEYFRSELFSLLNHRILQKKPFVIITSTSLSDVSQRYGESIFSRFTDVCQLYEFKTR